MGEIRIVNRRGNKSRFPSSTETTNTTETIPETPSTPIQIQEDIKMMTKMTYEEIKNALAAGKVFSRVGKNKSRTEVKLSEGKPVRRYISESGEVSDWAPAALNTMPRFEWEVSQSEPTTEVKPTTTIIKQVNLGDGTTTVITETIPVSEAPVVVDPFTHFEKELTQVAAKVKEVKAMDAYTRYSSTIYDGRKALLIILDFENKYAVDINDPTRVYRYSKEYGVVECGNAGIQDDKWDVGIDLNDFLTSEFRIITDPLDWKQAVEKVCEFDGRAAISIATGARIVYRDKKVCFEDGLTQEDMDSFWIVE